MRGNKLFWSGHFAEEILAIDQAGDVFLTRAVRQALGIGYVTIKFSGSDGHLVWSKQSPPVGSVHSANAPAAITFDANADVLVTGTIDYEFLTSKYDSRNGTLLWQQSFRRPSPTGPLAMASALAVDPQGDVIVSGAYDHHGYTAKYGGSDGAMRWEAHYNEPSRNVGSIQAAGTDLRGNVFVTGYSGQYIPTEIYTAKYSSAGTLLWAHQDALPVEIPGRTLSLAVDKGGAVLISGYSGTNSFFTAKHSTLDGTRIWSRAATNQYISDPSVTIVSDSKGDVLIGGYLAASSIGGYFAKYSGVDGAIIWEKRLDAKAQIIRPDSAGNLIATGYGGPRNGFTENIYTVKLSGADGVLLWEKVYDSTRGEDMGTSLALAENGDVIVTGYAARLYEPDFYTARYSGKDGSIIWERKYNGSGDSFDSAAGVLLDHNGDVIVAGTSVYRTDNRHKHGYCVLKYAGSDGALLWEQHYGLTPTSYDYARKLSLDANGNVVVTGTTAVDSHWGASRHIYTLKLSNKDGALLWTKLYDSGTRASDIPNALLTVPSGAVIVAGNSGFDLATIKYHEPSVALLNDGSINIQFLSDAGRKYILEGASLLSGPWATIREDTVPSDGYVLHSTPSRSHGSAYYRLTLRP